MVCACHPSNASIRPASPLNDAEVFDPTGLREEISEAPGEPWVEMKSSVLDRISSSLVGGEQSPFKWARKVNGIKPIAGIPIVFSVFVDDSQITVRLRVVVRDC